MLRLFFELKTLNTLSHVFEMQILLYSLYLINKRENFIKKSRYLLEI